MNCVNLLAALSMNPAPSAEEGEQMVVAELFLRPNHERDRRSSPDRLRVVALASSQAGATLMGLQKGAVIAVTGCLRCGAQGGYRIPELFAEQITVTTRGVVPPRAAVSAEPGGKNDQWAAGSADASDSEL